MVGYDPARGRSVQRSFTVHGDSDYAQARRRELVDDVGVTRVDLTSAGGRMTLGELVEHFATAPHSWRPATVTSHRNVLQWTRNGPVRRSAKTVSTSLVLPTPGSP